MRTNGAAFFRWHYATYAMHFFSTVPGNHSRPCWDVGRMKWVCPSCGAVQRQKPARESQVLEVANFLPRTPRVRGFLLLPVWHRLDARLCCCGRVLLGRNLPDSRPSAHVLPMYNGSCGASCL